MSNHKHQPNIKSLIHNFCNGMSRDMTCGSVSSGNGKLYSYHLPIVTRQTKDGRTFFGIASDGPSVTTSKHIRWAESSVPLDSGSRLASDCISDNPLDFQKIEKCFAEAWKDKQYSWIFRTGSKGVLETLGYRSMCDAIDAQLKDMSNPRVSRFSRIGMIYLYWEILLVRKYREQFCRTEKARTFGNVKKKISDYVQRLEKKLKAKEEREAKLNARYELVIRNNQTTFEDYLRRFREATEAHSALWLAGWRKEGYDLPVELILTERTRDDLAREYRDWADGIAELNNLEGFTLRYRFNNSREDGGFQSTSAKTYLRINGEEIETSRGARLPLAIGKGLWKRHEGLVRQIAQGADVKDSLPLAVGIFSWHSGRDGNLGIGCHTIPAEEIVTLFEGAE